MTYQVMTFTDGVGMTFSVVLYRVAPNAYGGGGSPPRGSCILLSMGR